MVRAYLVRHGRAAAGWNADADPGLDAVGVSQAERVADQLVTLIGAAAPLAIVTSPLRRCQETAIALAGRWGQDAVVDSAVGEIPSPPGVSMDSRVAWLRAAMVGTWTELDLPYGRFRDDVIARIAALDADTVVFSHFVAINAVIGACTGDDRLVIRHLDNTSVTVVDVHPSGLVLVEGGHEADTLIR